MGTEKQRPRNYRGRCRLPKDDSHGHGLQVGTHTGTYFGIEATGRTIEITGMDLFRICDGRIVEHWHEADHVAMFEQLGMEWKPISDTGSEA